MSYVLNIEQSLLDRIIVGRGAVFPFSGWAWHPTARVRRATLRMGERDHPAAIVNDLRLTVFAVLRQTERRAGHAIASGFWGLAVLDEGLPLGRYDLDLVVEWTDGHKDVRPLNSVILERARVPRPLARGSAAPALAVCMATYNPSRAAFARQIESIRAQTYTDWICIIQDDSSSAAGSAVIREVIGEDLRFFFEANRRNLGPYRNFERALERVPTDVGYVALSDQDDFWFPEKLERLVAKLESDATLLAYSDQRIVKFDGTVISNTYWTTRHNQYTDLVDLLLANTVTGAASVFRRRLLDIALPFPPKIGDAFHDHWLACCALAADRIGYVDRPLYDYIQYGTNMLGYSPFHRWASLRLILKIVGILPAVSVAVFVRWLRPRVRFALLNMVDVYQSEFRRLVVFSEILRLRVRDLAPEKSRALQLFTPRLENHWKLFRLGVFGADRHRRINNADLRLWSGMAAERITAHLAPPLLNLLAGRPVAPAPAAWGHAPLPGLAEAEHIVAKVAPLVLDVRDDAPKRVNIIMPELNLATFFGGYMAKINLAARLVQRGHAVRLILMDQQSCRIDHLNVIQREYCINPQIFDVIDVEERWDRSRVVTVNPADVFIATTWWTAHIANAALQDLGRTRFIYLIQEYEPFTFPMGSFHAMAHASYSFAHDALFSTRLLEEHFEENGIGAFASENRHRSLHRFFDNAIVRPPTGRAGTGSRKKLLFYARPEGHAARNLFEIGWAALKEAIAGGVLPEDQWEIVTIGSPSLPSELAGRTITNLGKKNLEDYRELLQDYDVGVSLMYTPHPSLVPLEMAAAGMVVLTSTCLNKTADKLRAISPNLIGAEPTVEGLVEGLAQAVAEADTAPRETRLNRVNWSFSWTTSFSDEIMDYLEACMTRQQTAQPNPKPSYYH